VGASRAVVDAGWVPYSYQVGQTGKSVSPRSTSRSASAARRSTVVGHEGRQADRRDQQGRGRADLPDADLGIVGDALAIVPQVIQEIRSRKS
jgi:electron transfer flavoprotein alpha subunit